MPSRSKSNPPSIPAKTHAEEVAQSILRWVALGITIGIGSLQAAYRGLPEPPDAEAMGEGTIPESLTFSLRGSIECAIADHLYPAQQVLEEAAGESPENLIREWQDRQESRP